MDQLLQDLRLTFRSLRRQGGFTTIVVLTLALGIGVNTAVFTGVHAMLLSPLPHLGLEGLTALAMRHATLSVEAYDFSFPDVEDFAAHCTLCEAVAAYDRRGVVLADDEGAQLIQGEAVSPGLFALLGVEPLLGRTLEPGEDERGRGGGAGAPRHRGGDAAARRAALRRPPGRRGHAGGGGARPGGRGGPGHLRAGAQGLARRAGGGFASPMSRRVTLAP